MYSVRMRATKDEMHISGAERLVDENDVKNAAQSMIERALSHDRGKPDKINISVIEIKIPIKEMTSLPINLFNVNSLEDGKKAARKVLAHIGIPDPCIERAFTFLENGPSNGENMRGAIVMNLKGERLEPDKRRGIRASHMDITLDASLQLANALSEKGLTRYFTHIKEALVLASKVASVKGTIAELCWSDDPFYTTGYVASKKLGYVRIPHLKKEGDYRGGRVFFVDFVNTVEINDYIEEIEKTPVLITKFDGLCDISENNMKQQLIQIKKPQQKVAKIGVLGAGGLGMAAARMLAKKKEMRLTAIADKTGFALDPGGINPQILESKKPGDIGIKTDDAVGELIRNSDELDGIFIALPNLSNDFIPNVVSQFAEYGYNGVMVDAMKRSGAVELIFCLNDKLKNAGITYITGAGATPGLLTCAAALAANSFMEVTGVDINFGVGVSNWESYRATIREDIAHLEGFDLEKAAKMTCAQIKEELDIRKGVLSLHNMEHADDVILERAGIVSREKVHVGGVVDTRNQKKPISTAMILTGRTFDGAVSSHRFILGDETTMAANVVGPALGWMKAGLEFHERGIFGVFGSAEIMPRFVQ